MPAIVPAPGVWKHKGKSIIPAIKKRLAVGTNLRLKTLKVADFFMISYYHKKKCVF